jgi:hypothetical protein
MKPGHLAALIAIVALLGCGDSGGKSTAKVSGKVTSGGQPVTEGNIRFTPLATGGDAGMPASGKIEPDGSYTLSTYGTNDGAVVGKHRIDYEEKVFEGTLQPGESPPASPYAGTKPNPAEVEVKAGSNTIDIDLAK